MHTPSSACQKGAAKRQSVRGQSLVEFALVLPMLLVLLLGIADFGRVFTAGITLEAAARNAAEVGALERLRKPPPSDAAARETYYADLHRIIAETACDEMEAVPRPDEDRAGADCQHLTAVRVCIHDGLDTRCGQAAAGIDSAVPGQCGALSARLAGPWPNTSGGNVASHFVEVHLCYQFSTLFNLDLSMPFGGGLSLGDVYLERERAFVVDCPPNAIPSC